MPNYTGERRLWPPDSDNEADLIELLGVKPEQLVAMAPPGQVKAKRYKLGARTEPFIHVALVAFLAGARALEGRKSWSSGPISCAKDTYGKRADSPKPSPSPMSAFPTGSPEAPRLVRFGSSPRLV